MKRILWIMALLPCAPALRAAPLVLVREGRPVASIVIPDDPSMTEAFAAEELATYVRKSSGATLPVLKERAAFAQPLAGALVLVGGTERAQALGVTLKGIEHGGFLVRRIGDALILQGEDDRTRHYQGVPRPVDPRQRSETRHGTLFAVYDLLEKQIGVRWYWPGDLGEVVPPRTTIAIDAEDYRENPDFEYRYCYGEVLDDPDFSPAESILWWRRQRWGGAGTAPATHAFAAYVMKYGATHPEYFALQKDGTRLTDTRHGGGHICLSNREFQQILIDDIIAGFRANPDRRSANVMPGDSFETYCCQCGACRAKYDESAEAGEQGHATFVAASGKHSRVVWGYVNAVAREVGRVFPDRLIGCCAYASYYAPPRGMPLEPNVAVTICRGNVDLYFWDGDDIARSHDDIRAWSRYSKTLFTWEYPLGAQAYGNPVIFPRGVNEEAKRMKRSGIRGTIVEYPSGYEPPLHGGNYTGWLREHLTTYVLFRTLWNADVDVDRIVDEYCRGLYGPAAGPVREFFARMERIWREGDHGAKPYYANWSNIWTSLYTDADIGRLLDLLKQAERQAPEGIYRRRVRKTAEAFAVLEINRQDGED